MARTRDKGADRSIWSLGGRARFGALALVALAMAALVLGLMLPVVYLRKGVSGDTYSVVAGIRNLSEKGNVLLALIVFAFSVVFPIAKLAALVALLFAPLTESRQIRSVRTLALLGRWSMLDVFVIAILVGAVQLGVLSDARPRVGIYVYACAILLSMVATVVFASLAGGDDSAREIEALETRGAGVRWLSPVAGCLFVVGLCLPVMDVEKWFFWDKRYSVLQGIAELAREGQAPLAAGILLFVVALPIARFAGLAWVQWGARSPRMARAVLTLDKWAMLDVFGLALLIVLVKIGDVAAVTPRPGFWVLLLATALSLCDSWWLHRRGT